MEDSRVDGTEVALDTTDFLLEDLVPEPRLEFTLSQRGVCDVHCILTTTKQDVGLPLCECSTFQRGFSSEGLDDHECSSIVNLQ